MRISGILLPVFSLPSAYGIGTFGEDAYHFVDFLESAGQSLWQILPLGTTGFGESPYQSFSSFAGNPLFIDPVLLEEAGLLTAAELKNLPTVKSQDSVDYQAVRAGREAVFSFCFSRFDFKSAEYLSFCREEKWLEDWALFAALKKAKGQKPFYEWEPELARRDPAALSAAKREYARECEMAKMQQFLFFSQWRALKKYANAKGIRILGDLPIYVPLDSCDVWLSPSEFLLNEDFSPVAVSGCPPDGFSPRGQLWGNPLYRWSDMEKEGFPWWKERVSFALEQFDYCRIDHFRGLESYWSVPYPAMDAVAGEWKKGPGMKLMRALRENADCERLVAEDLGFLTPAVKEFLAESRLPGMKVLEFGFDDPDSDDFLPHSFPQKSLAYVGTHDNDTALGFWENAPEEVRERACTYPNLTESEGIGWGFMRGILASPSDWAILSFQDLIALGSEGRINIPGTVGENWRWRARSECVNPWLAGILREKCAVFHRLPAKRKAQ